MMFNGAAEYFFYQGISRGVNNTIESLPGMLSDKFNMDNATTRECLEMFELGFYYGLVMSPEDLNELTVEDSSSTIVVTDDVTETLKKQKIQPNHLGNC